MITLWCDNQSVIIPVVDNIYMKHAFVCGEGQGVLNLRPSSFGNTGFVINPSIRPSGSLGIAMEALPSG